MLPGRSPQGGSLALAVQRPTVPLPFLVLAALLGPALLRATQQGECGGLGDGGHPVRMPGRSGGLGMSPEWVPRG